MAIQIQLGKTEFHRWFNRDFWRAFKNRTFPINIPQTEKEKYDTVEAVRKSILSARYAPNPPEAEMIINKGYGVARTIPVFCIQDYCVYYFCIKELESILCINRTPNTFGGWTLGGKFRKLENVDIGNEASEYGRYSFNPLAWTQAFGEFNSLIFSQLGKRNYSHVLEFDLSNFFDSIRLDILERWIREEAGKEKGWIIALLFYFLNHWNRRNTGLHPQIVGLPQDALADCSRILSNYYLQKYDSFVENICSKAGAMYFRYSDDQMILMNNPDITESLMLRVTRELDRYGLRVNQKKVRLWRASQIAVFRCQKMQALFAKTGAKQDPAIVKRFATDYFKIPENKLVKLWKGGAPLLNRLLWANIESLPNKLFIRVRDRLLSSEFLTSADRGKLIRISEFSRKRPGGKKMRSILKDLGQKSVHNSFHYEALAFAIANKDAELKSFFKKRLKDLRNIYG